MISKKKMAEIEKLDSSWRSNCWNATAFILGVTKRIQWWEEVRMYTLLNKSCVEVPRSQVRRGDIVALLSKDYKKTESHSDWFSQSHLLHTAVCLGGSNYWHKPGSEPAGLTSLKAMQDEYALITKKGLEVRFFRLFKNCT